MEPEHLELLSFFPVFLHLLRCVVWGAAGVCKCLFKGQICRLVDHPTLHLPVLFCCVSFDEFPPREPEGGPESEMWLTSSCLILIVSQQSHSHVWIPVSFSFVFPWYVFDRFATLDLSESLSISEAYFLNCQTPSIVNIPLSFVPLERKGCQLNCDPSLTVRQTLASEMFKCEN